MARKLLSIFAVLLSLSSLGCDKIVEIYNTIKTGAPCETQYTCLDGACLTQLQGFPGGMCSGKNCKETGCWSLFTECFNTDIGGEADTYCLPTCQNGRTCERPESYSCQVLNNSFVCAPTVGSPLGTTPVGVTGAPCTVDAECLGSENNPSVCMTDLENGYCTQQCSIDEDCVTGGALCLLANRANSPTAKICFKPCTDENQCRPGYQCKTHEGRSVCLPGTNKVRNPNGTEDGTPCKTNLTCMGGTCIRENGGEKPKAGEKTPYPGGYCTTRGCTTEADCNLPTGEALCTARGRHTACFKKCNTDTDCRQGYTCTDTIDGKICDSAAPLPDVKTEDHGNGITVQCTRNSDISFTIPNGAIGFFIAPFTKNGARLTPQELIRDSAPPLNLNIPTDYAFEAINPEILGSLAPMLFPASNQNRFKNAFGGGNYRMSVQSRASEICYYVIPKMSEGSHIRVKLHFVGVAGVNARSALSHPGIQHIIKTMKQIYQQMGISVEISGLLDASPEVARRFQIIRNYNDIYTLAATTTKSAKLEVDVFLIRDFAIDEAPGLLGVSTGIPGMAGMSGTIGSGLVFTTAGLDRNAQQLGQTMAHEIGHFLGLRHTTEHNGVAHDPITDTGECRNPRLQYACPDARNFMFAFAMGPDQIEATAGQAFVLRRSPLVTAP